MKKNDYCIRFTKRFNFDKLLFVLIVVFQCLTFLNEVSAQTQKMTYTATNVTVKEVFQAIKQQTALSMTYSVGEIDTDRKVSVKAVNKPVTDVLNHIFAGTTVTYVIKDNHIVLSNKTQEADTKKAETINGVVKDAAGLAIIGVAVIVDGGSKGTTTDTEGRYSIKATSGEKITFSYLGYTTKTITVAPTTSVLNVTLTEDVTALDEVVVTALGIKRKTKALSYNVAEISSSDITSAKDANFVKSLSGKVAGLIVNSSAAGVGGSTKVVMRGAKSITKDNNALYVVDGIPLFTTNNGNADGMYAMPGGESISDFNPEDIESMSFLTGPAAAALYGSNAANGAILITTKKGVAGKAKITFAHSTDFMKPFITPKFQNTYGNMQGEYTSWGLKLDTPSSFDPMNFFQTGFNTTNSVSVSVGTEKNQTFFSVASTNAEGIMPNNEYNRYNFTVRNTTKILNDKATLDLSASYILQDDQNIGAQGQYFNPLIPLYLFPRGEDFDMIKLYERIDESRDIPVQFWPYGDGGTSMQNPYWITKRNMFTNDKKRYMFSAGLKYDFFDWLNVNGRIRVDNDMTVAEKKLYAGTSGKFAQAKGYYGNTKQSYNQTYGDVMANINKSFGDFDITANIGASIFNLSSDLSEFRGQLKSNPNVFTVNNVDLNATNSGPRQQRWREQTQSVFASAEVGYKSMLYLSATARNDWSSALANTNSPSFFYPSVGLSAIVTEMINAPKWLSYLKLRGSYSAVGSAPQRHITIPTYPFELGTVATISHYPIHELFPEMTKSYEVGVDMKLFQSKLDLDFTYYKSNTSDQTFITPVSASSGYSTMIIQTGDIQNHGFEVSLGYNQTFAQGLRWDSQVTFSMNRNKIKKLADNFPDPITGNPLNIPEMQVSKVGSYLMKLVPGGSIGDIYATTFLRTDNQGDIWVNPDSQILGAPVNETIKIGNTNPKANIGFRNGLSYKGLNLGVLFTARIGGNVVSATEAALDNYGVSERSAIARENGGVPINFGKMDPQYFYQYIGGGETGMVSQYVYSATNVRLQELTLGYTLPAKWFNEKVNMTVSFVGRNLWMIYNRAPFDPELTSSTGTYYQGFDYFMQPSTRNLGFSVRLQF